MLKNIETLGKLGSSKITQIEALLDSSLALYNNGASDYFIDLDEIRTNEIDEPKSESVLLKLIEILEVDESKIKNVSLINFYVN